MDTIPLTLDTNVFDQFVVGCEDRVNRIGPGPGVERRVLDRDLSLEMTEVPAPVTLGDPKRLRGRSSARQVDLAVEAARFDHQRILLPMANAVSQPGGRRILGQRPSVEEDLAKVIEVFVENRNQFRHLQDLPGRGPARHGRGPRNTPRFDAIFIVVFARHALYGTSGGLKRCPVRKGPDERLKIAYLGDPQTILIELPGSR